MENKKEKALEPHLEEPRPAPASALLSGRQPLRSHHRVTPSLPLLTLSACALDRLLTLPRHMPCCDQLSLPDWAHHLVLWLPPFIPPIALGAPRLRDPALNIHALFIDSFNDYRDLFNH